MEGSNGGDFQPIPWCAGMVVVVKKSGAVRICVDLKTLLMREVHPIPGVDHGLEGLEGVSGLIDDTLVHGKDESDHELQIPRGFSESDEEDELYEEVEDTRRQHSQLVYYIVAVTGRKRTLFHCKWANSINYITRMLY